MNKGEVKLFDNKRGFGFIKWSGDDLFVHFTDIEADDEYKKLFAGQKVEFEIKQAPRGPQAIRVKIIED
ncbi:cold-shock protein [Anaerococcus tetradius]|uniref:cold-shock protein n=1 Tax=Anaerococcus tetradius TaxID=33036 RepID=UPI0023F00106|nr:cold shock domain-containing protein [Anaerococcus tetradius]